MLDTSIVARRDLDFGFSPSIPAHWFGGDPFRSRLFDADSVLTPCAERFFIGSVRVYREQISDPVLSEQVAAFIAQEGQHSRQHMAANERLKEQGIDVEGIEAECADQDSWLRRWLPASFNLSITAANEYLTAVTSASFLSHVQHLDGADERIFALYAWHCAEEFEHKSVCFDLMQKVARVGYLQRIAGMLWSTPMFAWRLSKTVNRMLRADGYGFGQRLRVMFRGCAWMYGGKGLTRYEISDYLAYFRPDFHPSRLDAAGAGYGRWRQAFDDSGGDVLQAARALRATT